MEYKFSMDNFEKEVLNSSEPVLVDFFATWCGVCEKEGPIITELAEEYTGKVKIGKLDVDENPALAQDYDVSTIPNMVFLQRRESRRPGYRFCSGQCIEEQIRFPAEIIRSFCGYSR